LNHFIENLHDTTLTYDVLEMVSSEEMDK
jgi:hypothetical protein